MMMTSTKVSIGSAVTWFLLNLIANASAPSGLNDPSFREKVDTASTFQGLASLFLIIAIVAIVVTGYKKVMSKQIEHHETNINASHNAVVATHSASVATGNATIDNSTNVNLNSQVDGVSNDKLVAIQELIKYVKNGDLNEEDNSVARFIVDDLEVQFSEETPNSEKILSFSNKLASLIESAKPVAESVVRAIELLKG